MRLKDLLERQKMEKKVKDLTKQSFVSFVFLSFVSLLRAVRIGLGSVVVGVLVVGVVVLQVLAVGMMVVSQYTNQKQRLLIYFTCENTFLLCSVGHIIPVLCY